jgi:hypothetical protein
MPYAIRNSIILAVLLVLFTGAGGGYIYFYQDKELGRLNQEHKEIREKLGDVSDLYNRLAATQLKVQSLTAAWSHRPKSLPAQEIAAHTNEYINEILSFSPDLDLNVLTTENVPQNGCGYMRYHLAGQGPFFSFARLLQYLEHGPRMMKLRNMDVRSVSTPNVKTGITEYSVQFDIDLLAYYSDQAAFADSVSLPPLKDVTFKAITYNPFIPLVSPDIPPNVYDLPDIEKSSLLAVMKGRAFISDQHNQLVMLSEGDEVYLGYVSKIMPERKQVLFLLNKGGIVERYILTLRFQTKFEASTKK